MVALEEIKRLKEIAKELNFETCEQFYLLTDKQLQKIYNGCGPEWLPEKFRKILSWYYSFFAAAFLVHDVGFEFSDKTRKSFNACNNRLYANCMKLAAQVVAWRIITRIHREAQAWRIYINCHWWGWKAWVD